ncbi:MAG: hypothetical protein RDU89_07065 [bacterium]|nr:hypothetical protein [bacterium]
MSSQPQGWQTPKTDWTPADGVADADINRIEGNAQATELGDRTVDPDLSPSSNVGTLRQLLSWFANRIKAITGTTNWWDAPAATLGTIWGKFHASTGHGHTGGTADGPKVGTTGLADGAVTEAKLGSGAVTSGKLGALAVIAGKIADGAVDTLARIASGIRTSAGGTEANRLAVTNSSGRVGDSERLGGQLPSAYAPPHVEAKISAGEASNESVTWTTAFASTPIVVVSPFVDHDTSRMAWVRSRSTTGATAQVRYHDNATATDPKLFIAVRAT